MILGIADPFRVLEPGEVFVQFLVPLFNEQNSPITSLEGKKVIVARHPSLVPSDMQAFDAVWRREFRDFHNVIIFSSKGQEPGASKLQGGDYDGDTFWVCFSTSLTRTFMNAAVPQHRPGPEHFGIIVDRRSVADVAGTQYSIAAFLHTSLKFRGETQMLGHVTKAFERLAYLVGNLHNPGVQTLASMHHLLIDSNKSGFKYNEQLFKAFIANDSSIDLRRLPSKTAYEIGMEASVKLNNGYLLCGAKAPADITHPVDIIFFTVILPASRSIMRTLLDRLTFSPFTEPLYQHFVEQSTATNDIDAREVLDGLGREITHIHAIWNYAMRKNDSDSRAQTIEKCYARFMEYMPSRPQSEEVARWTWTRLPGEPSTWLLLKAAKLYMTMHTKQRTSFMFHIGGRQLAYLKAMSLSDTETTIASLFSLLKPGKVSATGPSSTQRRDTTLSGTAFATALGQTEGRTEDIDDDDDFYSTCAVMYDEEN